MPAAKAGGKAKKKSGKSKLSKAEKERLRKDEAERKAQEEEEARIKAEQEAREKLEKEKQEREERRKLEEQERAQHQAEIDELNAKLKENKEKLLLLQKDQRRKEKWHRYMLCDGRPDPTSKKELNTYMNLWRDDNGLKPFKQILNESQLTLELISELEECIEQDELDTSEINLYEESIHDMHALLESKIDEATMWLLKCPENNINQETQNLECIANSESFTICVWGNVAKNPRVKSVDFPTEGFSIEIPKSLVLADVAVRVVYKLYDNLSQRCSTYFPKMKKSFESQQDEQVTENEKPELDGEVRENCDRIEEVTTSYLEPGTEKVGSRKSSRKSMGRLSASSQNEDVTATTQEESGNENADVEEIDREQNVFDDVEDLIDEDVVDLRSFSALQPIVIIELLELPPQRQQKNSWLMQQLVSAELKRSNYHVQNQDNLARSLTESQYLEQDSNLPGSAKSSSSVPNTPNAATSKPMAITLKIPDKVMIFEDPQMARWDETSCHWKTDGFIDVVYDEDSRTVSFRTGNFGPISIMQDLYVNMPFQSWDIRPLNLNNCIFTVIAAAIDVSIEIENSMCCVRKPNENKEISHLVGVWMSPRNLIKSVRNCGINIFPAVDGEKYVSICKKDPVLIDNLYEQIALSSSAFAYCWSKWNSESGEDTVILGATEWRKMEQPTEDDYLLYMASNRICCKLAMNEYDEHLSKDVAKHSHMHPDLFHMVQDGSSEDARNTVLLSTFEYVHCVHQLLKATNIMIYS